MAVRFDRLYHRIQVVLNLPDFTEPYSCISGKIIEHVTLCIEVSFILCWRNVSDGTEQAFVIESIDPSERGHFQIWHVASRPLPMGQFGIVEPVNHLS